MKIRTLVTLLPLLTAALLAGCFGNNEDAKIRGQFVKGCLTSGLDDDTCKCAFDKMEEHYGMEKLRQLEKRPYDLPADFEQFSLNSMLICAGKEPIPFPHEAPEQSPAPAPSATAEPETSLPLGEQDVSTLNAPGERPTYEISPNALPGKEGELTSAPTETSPAP